MYKIHLTDNVCNSGQLWGGYVGEPSSLNQRIEKCTLECNDNIDCKFMTVNIDNDWCQIFSSCTAHRTSDLASITFSKRGNFVFIISIQSSRVYDLLITILNR